MLKFRVEMRSSPWSEKRPLTITNLMEFDFALKRHPEIAEVEPLFDGRDVFSARGIVEAGSLPEANDKAIQIFREALAYISIAFSQREVGVEINAA